MPLKASQIKIGQSRRAIDKRCRRWRKVASRMTTPIMKRSTITTTGCTSRKAILVATNDAPQKMTVSRALMTVIGRKSLSLSKVDLVQGGIDVKISILKRGARALWPYPPHNGGGAP